MQFSCWCSEDLDQTVPIKEQSDLGPHCLPIYLLYISQYCLQIYVADHLSGHFR